MKHSNRLTTSLALVLTLGAGGCLDQDADPITAPDFGVVGLERGPAEDFRVYTQNLWLGGDTGPLFSLDFSDLGAVIPATNAFWGEVQASDIPARAAEIADEIEATLPHVVGLQEAVGYATGSLNLAASPPEFTPTAPGPDLLGAVMAELRARGLPYGIMEGQPYGQSGGKGVVLQTTSIALPTEFPDGSVAPALGVQDRVVMLVHNDAEVVDWDTGLYPARLPLGPADVVRGWVRVTMERNGMPYHFVVTHLETQGSADPSDPIGFGIRQVHNGQAAELQGAILAALDGNVVLMGDLNSDANADPSQRSWTPTYGNLTDAGFIDVWGEAPHRGNDDGVTCCFEPGRTPDERIDFVLLRQAESLSDRDAGHHRGFYRADIVGDEMSDQIGEDLWPSDHAGIVADISEPTLRR